MVSNNGKSGCGGSSSDISNSSDSGSSSRSSGSSIVVTTDRILQKIINTYLNLGDPRFKYEHRDWLK